MLSSEMDHNLMSKVLAHFSRLYESDYPNSDRVKNGLLIGVLRGKYGGNVEQFKEFLHHTIILVENLSQMVQLILICYKIWCSQYYLISMVFINVLK